ncbi:ATP-dependent RNA helicase DEAH13-like isoform X2 [Rosa rugosa]|uniref:ATP-dependent RNA helicase DEAH13-like isoform X2 n=1 Tax=Rosa rugosa TaxID=74645 RepID=UPI002B40CE72|nr:ATP-dependent RNA helicase DEAH13-like isoform X2 [Rosa rugosa]
MQDKVEESPESSYSSKLPAPSILKDPKNRRHVSRPPEVVKARSDIPIIMMEQEIMEAINENSTVIIRGETGCGKTTQVPQFLYEVGIGSSVSPLGSGILGVTQPRRIAVYATASRVAYELGVRVGEEVGYQVRYDKKIGKSCSINFMTDGILLRELQGDFWLKRYSVIILDEVHERNLSTDTLIGMLSRVIICRQKEYERQQEFLQQYSHLGISIDREKLVFPLKLVLMSATMPVEDFISYRKLFPDPPQEINVLSRQFKVDIQFSTTTKADYTKEACKKVLEIHKNMPQGGILVFVTGYWEVEVLCEKLRRASRELTMKKKKGCCVMEGSVINSVGEVNMKENSKAFHSANHQNDVFSYTDEDQCEVDDDEFGSSYDTETESELEIIGDDADSLCQDAPEVDGEVAQILGENVSIASLKASFESLAGKSSSDSTSCKEPISRTLDFCSSQSNHSRRLGKKDAVVDDSVPGSLRVLPLYSMLPAAAQHRVFDKVKEGERLVVVATNVAETSVTIPGIKYVVDTGKVKSKEYNFKNGSEIYKVQWISKASAVQRAGRAGRTGPGHCFRLYSSAAFNNIFDDSSPSEISKVPLEGLILLLKSMDIELSAFPFLTRPKDDALNGGQRCLEILEALTEDGEVTPLGKAMAYYPISPRHSKMLLTAIKMLNKEKSYKRPNLVLAYAVASAAALSLSNIFVSQFEDSCTENHDLIDGNSSAPVHSEVIDKQERVIKEKKVRASCENFSSHSSDALSRAYVLRLYELSKSRLHFCKDNALHPETMHEISELREQLLKLVFYHSGVSGGEFSWIHGSQEDVEHDWRADVIPLSLDEEGLLCRAICAGWADRVAKRIKGSKNQYQTCLSNENVFLDRQSSVSKIAPEYLVYSELIQKKKPYMHGVTCIEPEWLVDCGRVLCKLPKGSAPYYDRVSDKVLYNVTPTFGPHLWKLPEHCLPIDETEFKGAVQAFAFALLDGKVLRCLRPVRAFMAEHPRTVLKPVAANRERVQNLLLKLGEKKIHSRAMLREVWSKNPNELYLEIRNWFRKNFHCKFKDIWVEMLREAIY